MRKIADNSDMWMGLNDDNSLKTTRSFIDKLQGLTDLCIKNENRVLDFGGAENGKKEDEEFEFLNLSELKDQWDDEDMRVLNQDELVDSHNQTLLRHLKAYEIPLGIIK